MGYQYDIFISYRRDEETRGWLENHFLRILKVRVRQELTREPDIFVDSQLESGVSWPERLGIALGSSRILIALWAKDYFASLWCTEEMAHMLAREQGCGLRTPQNPQGLVIPAVIHDGKEFPQDISHIQRFEIQRVFNLRMAHDSPRAEELDDIITREAPAMVDAINAAPEWRRGWPYEAAEAFRRKLHTVAPSQVRPPGFAD